MSRRKRKLRTRLSRYWLSDRGLGKSNRLVTVGRWLFFIPLLKYLQRLAKVFFRFRTPDWIIELGKSVYPVGTRVSWYHLLNPLYWIVWSLALAFQLLISRPYMSLGPALPAMVVGAVLIGIAFAHSVGQSDWRGTEYRRTLARAVESENHKLARIALLNLISRYPERTEYRLQQALLEDKLGNEKAASKAMLLLASSKQNSTAAYWLLTRYYKLDDLVDWTQEKHRDFNALMDVALRNLNGQNEVSARTLRGSYLLSVGATEEAVRNFESVAGRNRDLQIITANLYSQLNNPVGVKLWGERAEAYYREQLLASPADKPARLNLARTLILLQREEEATRLLSDGFKITGDKELSQAGGEALAAWANRIRISQPTGAESTIRQLQLLKRAAELAPNNTVVLETLIQTILKCAEDDSGQVDTLRRAMIGGLDPESMHFVEGTVALLKGDLEAAKTHLEIASTSTKSLPGVLNNMAVVLYQQSNPDLEKALKFAEAAVAQMPNEPVVRETRGQILLRMREYKKSIVDLEFALREPGLTAGAHEALAVAYDALNQPKIAEQHRKAIGGFKPK